jgi:hypothetical protein
MPPNRKTLHSVTDFEFGGAVVGAVIARKNIRANSVAMLLDAGGRLANGTGGIRIVREEWSESNGLRVAPRGERLARRGLTKQANRIALIGGASASLVTIHPSILHLKPRPTAHCRLDRFTISHTITQHFGNSPAVDSLRASDGLRWAGKSLLSLVPRPC